MPGAFGIPASSLIRHSDFVIPVIAIRGLFRILFNDLTIQRCNDGEAIRVNSWLVDSYLRAFSHPESGTLFTAVHIFP